MLESVLKEVVKLVLKLFNKKLKWLVFINDPWFEDGFKIIHYNNKLLLSYY